MKYASGEEPMVGDVVECVDYGDFSQIKNGEKYEVEKLVPPYVRLKGVGGFNDHRFKLVKRAEPKAEKPTYPRYFGAGQLAGRLIEGASHIEIREPGGTQIGIWADGREEELSVTYAHEGRSYDEAHILRCVAQGMFKELTERPSLKQEVPWTKQEVCFSYDVPSLDPFDGCGEDKATFEKRRDAAELTLRNGDFTYVPGARMWKPPVGKHGEEVPRWLDRIDALEKQLEAEKRRREKTAVKNSELSVRAQNAENRAEAAETRCHNLDIIVAENRRHAEFLHGRLKASQEKLAKLGPTAEENVHALNRISEALSAGTISADKLASWVCRVIKCVLDMRDYLIKDRNVAAAMDFEEMLAEEEAEKKAA